MEITIFHHNFFGLFPSIKDSQVQVNIQGVFADGIHVCSLKDMKGAIRVFARIRWASSDRLIEGPRYHTVPFILVFAGDFVVSITHSIHGNGIFTYMNGCF